MVEITDQQAILESNGNNNLYYNDDSIWIRLYSSV